MSWGPPDLRIRRFELRQASRAPGGHQAEATRSIALAAGKANSMLDPWTRASRLDDSASGDPRNLCLISGWIQFSRTSRAKKFMPSQTCQKRNDIPKNCRKKKFMPLGISKIVQKFMPPLLL